VLGVRERRIGEVGEVLVCQLVQDVHAVLLRLQYPGASHSVEVLRGGRQAQVGELGEVGHGQRTLV
jgi:hypothetical protein